MPSLLILESLLAFMRTMVNLTTRNVRMFKYLLAATLIIIMKLASRTAKTELADYQIVSRHDNNEASARTALSR
jgi:hypothetical protein